MNQLIESITNREYAILFWIVIFIIFMFSQKDVRKSSREFFSSLYGLKLTFLIAILCISINILLVNLLFYGENILKEIIVWCVVGAFPLMWGAETIKSNKDYFKRVIQKSIRLVVIVAFIVNSYTFSILGEIILLLVLALFSLTSTTQYGKEKNNTVKNFSDYMLLILGLIMVIGAIVGFLNEPSKLLAMNKLYTFFTPVILTVLFFPFLYIFALVMEYENFLIRLKIFSGEEFSKIKILFYTFKFCKFNLYILHDFSKYYNSRRVGGTEDYVMILIENYKNERMK